MQCDSRSRNRFRWIQNGNRLKKKERFYDAECVLEIEPGTQTPVSHQYHGTSMYVPWYWFRRELASDFTMTVKSLCDTGLMVPGSIPKTHSALYNLSLFFDRFPFRIHLNLSAPAPLICMTIGFALMYMHV